MSNHCPVCYWINNSEQFADPDYEGGPNNVSLWKARKNFKKYGACQQDLVKSVRNPKADEVFISEEEVEVLLEKLKHNPADQDLINNVAIGCSENPQLWAEDTTHPLTFFKRAYDLKKTVKSTNNYAGYLYFERHLEEEGLHIQKECMELNPKSHYPYYQYGYMLLEQGLEHRFYEKYRDYPAKALEYFNISGSKATAPIRRIEHHEGVAHFLLKDFTKAKNSFLKAIGTHDVERLSSYNLALTYYQLGEINKVREIADELDVNLNTDDQLDRVFIAKLYYLIEDYKMCAACALKDGVSADEAVTRAYLSYSILQTDKTLFREHLADWIADAKTIAPKEESIEIIEKLERLETELAIKPVIDSDEALYIEYYNECYLFDCKRHNIPKDD